MVELVLAHATALFKKIKENTKGFEEFLIEINKHLQGTNWEKVDEHTLTVEYSQCFCPLVGTKLVALEQPTRCYCSIGWLKENLKLVLGKEVQVQLEASVAQGAPQCRFTVQF